MKLLPLSLIAMTQALGVSLAEPYEKAVRFSYCGECPMLSVTERKQKRGEKHLCNKYNKQVFHMGRHPNIVRVVECDEPEVTK